MHRFFWLIVSSLINIYWTVLLKEFFKRALLKLSSHSPSVRILISNQIDLTFIPFYFFSACLLGEVLLINKMIKKNNKWREKFTKWVACSVRYPLPQTVYPTAGGLKHQWLIISLKQQWLILRADGYWFLWGPWPGHRPLLQATSHSSLHRVAFLCSH